MVEEVDYKKSPVLARWDFVYRPFVPLWSAESIKSGYLRGCLFRDRNGDCERIRGGREEIVAITRAAQGREKHKIHIRNSNEERMKAAVSRKRHCL